MPQPLSPQEFVNKWRHVTANERKVAQEHFIDLCRLLNFPTPSEGDPRGKTYTFEAGADKTDGSHGWADVWKRGYFAWEYKTKHADLDKAYDQLLKYRESLDNPPLLVVSDIDRIIIHTNFTNTAKKVVTLTLDDLLTPRGLETLRWVFEDPGQFKSPETTEQVTERASREFGKLAEILRRYGAEPHAAAHFLIRVLFCLFAEDVGLLPRELFTKLVTRTWMRPKELSGQLHLLFHCMANGGWFGEHEIMHFDGGLFDDDTVIDLDSDGIKTLSDISGLDWSNIEPSIFGTLFERSLDPSKRSQIGAHYTGTDDILLIVEPVLMSPLRRRWEEVQAEANKLASTRDAIMGNRTATVKKRNAITGQIRVVLMNFSAELARVQVLDPACGSGNFLYVALRQLLDLEKRVSTLSAELGVGYFQPTVNPAQLHGIEINPFAHELAQATVWIGYIQWLRENGLGHPPEPILKPLHTILNMDAILQYDEQGKPCEPEWPSADVIIGNPPFLGDKKMRSELGDKYVTDLRALYGERIPGQSDLVCYWFEKARAMIEEGKVKRAGLLATQGIRGGANRRVLERIKQTGDIFWAMSDRDWVLDGANVHVSMVGFDNGTEKTRQLDGQIVLVMNPNLTTASDLTLATRLPENFGIAYVGDTKKGAFDIQAEVAKRMLNAPLNPNRRPNSDVVRRWANALEITRRPQDMWIIDFGVNASEESASQYEEPFEYVKRHVKPIRARVRNEQERHHWWIHGRPAAEMREAVVHLKRYIATPVVSKHRVFSWIDRSVLCDHAICIIARDDDYFFGVLQSRLHEVWALAKGTALEDRPRYSQTMTFETFPFPWPPGKEPQDDLRVQRIAGAARELVQLRDNWLNPPDMDEAELKKRTLTNLYNKRPEWLDLAHKKLDEAVLDAYGWPHDLSDEDILARLLALNLERAGT